MPSFPLEQPHADFLNASWDVCAPIASTTRPLKGREDRDVMLSPVLLDELRAHWRRMRKESSVWLFPGNRWHTGDQPIDTKTPRHASQYAARRAGIKKKLYLCRER